ncbi:MAG TPA: serine hydrolase [Longimicrobiales bacterium]|nr:serine hydrolase [Longimicrobiales bacterium]
MRLHARTATRVLASPAAALAVLLALAASACGQTPDAAVFPGAEWEEVAGRDLEGYGWSPAGLRQAFEFLRDSSNATGVVVVDRGRVVFDFGDVSDLSYVASVRKSVLSILYGAWVEDGTIDLDATLAALGVDDQGGLLERERQATVGHLITARSGVYHPASNGGDNLADAPPRGSQEPGAYMLYNNWDFNAAGAVFEQLTGRDIYDEVERQLAGPLRFQDWDRDAQRKSGDLEVSRNPAYHMWLSTRDMARIGLLMLNEGTWEGEQIVSRDWANRIVDVVTPLEEMNPVGRRGGYFGYGYMWWVWDGPRAVGPFEGAYTARGAWGQWITVFPAVDLVVAVKTNSVYSRTTSWESWHRLLELLFDARGIRVGGPWPWAG